MTRKRSQVMTSGDSGSDEDELYTKRVRNGDDEALTEATAQAKEDLKTTLYLEKFPYLRRVAKVVAATGLHLGVWALFGLVFTGVFAFVVGLDEAWASVQAAAGGAVWLWGWSGLVADIGFVVLGFMYLLWLFDKRELLNPSRAVYTPTGTREWRKLRKSLRWSVPLAAVTGYGVFAGFPASVPGWVLPVSAGLCWVASYRSVKWMSKAVYEDEELEKFRVLQSPWKWVGRMSLAYGPYLVVAGGLRWVPFEVGVAFGLAAPFVGVAYLVRRRLGGRVWGERNVSRADMQAARKSMFMEKAKGRGWFDSESQGEIQKADEDSEWEYEVSDE